MCLPCLNESGFLLCTLVVEGCEAIRAAGGYQILWSVIPTPGMQVQVLVIPISGTTADEFLGVCCYRLLQERNGDETLVPSSRNPELVLCSVLILYRYVSQARWELISYALLRLRLVIAMQVQPRFRKTVPPLSKAWVCVVLQNPLATVIDTSFEAVNCRK